MQTKHEFIDHTKQGSIDRHKETASHIDRKKSVQKQQSLISTLNVSTAAGLESIDQNNSGMQYIKAR